MNLSITQKLTSNFRNNFSREESKHIVKVLRKKTGDHLNIMMEMDIYFQV